MKKILIIWLLLLWTFIVTWCSDSGVENPEIIDEEVSIDADDACEDEDCEYEWWWERSTVITDMCAEEEWKIEDDMCLYPDWTFCYLDDMTVNECYRWLLKYGVDNIEND